MKDLDKLFEFLAYINEFRLVTRTVKTNDKRQENDLEHSFTLAIVCWYIIDKEKLDLEIGKVLKYALAHDLIEVYSGDTDPYISKKDYIDSKSDREKRAFEKIKEKFPDNLDIHQAIQEYEDQSTIEARFVCGIDGLIPSMSVYSINEKYYSENKVSFEKFYNWNINKVKEHEYTLELIDKLSDYYKKNRPEFFCKDIKN